MIQLKIQGNRNVIEGNSDKNCYSLLVGQERILCPDFLHFPQSLCFFEGGVSDGDEGGCVLELFGATIGVLALLRGLGAVGFGKVTSWSDSGQRGRISSKRYHAHSKLSPFERILEG